MNVEARISQLEKRNRLLNCWLICLTGVLSITFLTGAKSTLEYPQEISVKKITLLDTNKKTGPLVLTAAGINKFNASLRVIAYLGESANHGGMVEVKPNKGKGLFRVSTTQDGGTGIVLYGSKGKDGIELDAFPSGRGSIKIYNDLGKNALRFSTLLDGHGLIMCNTAGGKESIILTQTKSDSSGLILMKNKTGKVIFNVSANEYGHGKMGVYDIHGKGRTIESW